MMIENTEIGRAPFKPSNLLGVRTEIGYNNWGMNGGSDYQLQI